MLGAGFTDVNSQPVKAEMSVATPKSQAKEPIQLDIILVCRKQNAADGDRPSVTKAMESARAKLRRLQSAGFTLSRNDRKIVLFGQLLTTLQIPADTENIALYVDSAIEITQPSQPTARNPSQLLMFD